jgi:hypothetical protein
MKRYLCYAALLFAFACSSDDDLSKEDFAVQKACAKCNLGVSEMLWLRSKIITAETTNGKATSIYAIETASNGVVIVDQPVVMSCLACARYDCKGNVIVNESVAFMQELQAGMSKENLLYSTF